MKKNEHWQRSPMKARHDTRLKPLARLIYIDLVGLSYKKGFCWACNKKIAENYGITPACVSRLINDLKRAGYIDIEIDPKNCRKITIMEIAGPLDQIVNAPRPNDQPLWTKRATPLDQTSYPSRPNELPLCTKKSSPIAQTVEGGVSQDVVQDNDTGAKNDPNYIIELDKGTRKKELDKGIKILDTSVSNKPPKKTSPGARILNDQYVALINRWNELTGQEQVVDIKTRNMFYGKVKKHGYDKVLRAVENYALNPWNQEKQTWTFIQIWTKPSFIGDWVNKNPRVVPESESDRAILEVLEWDRRTRK